jgi:hypothetical protein
MGEYENSMILTDEKKNRMWYVQGERKEGKKDVYKYACVYT